MAEDSKKSEHMTALRTKVQQLAKAEDERLVKTRARREKIVPEFVGRTLGVFNGRGYTNVRIEQEMVGKQLGEVAPFAQPTACSKYLSIPPRKMRIVGDLIKGRPVEDALNILNFTPRIAARHMANTLKSAVANKLSFEGTDQLQPEDLLVKNVTVEPGPTAKRIRFRAMGRAFHIRKRFCHLNIFLEERPDLERPVEAKGAVKEKTTKARAETGETKVKAAKKKTAAKAKTKKVAPSRDKSAEKKSKVTSESKKVTKKTGSGSKKV